MDKTDWTGEEVGRTDGRAMAKEVGPMADKKKVWTVESWNAWLDSKFPPRTNDSPARFNYNELVARYPGLGRKR